MLAVPAIKAPTIDGDLSDWDWSAAEPVWIAPETAPQMHGEIALMYDQDALYFAAKATLPNRALLNKNSPVDPFWIGDMLELRLVSDPALPYPVDPNSLPAKICPRIIHISFWKNTDTDKDYLHLAYGLHPGPKAANPEGSAIVIKTNGKESYTLECRIPWSALRVPEGKCPFKPGEKMTAILGIHWGQANQTPALYRENPGDFAFQRANTWGQVEFSEKGHLPPRHKTMQQAIAEQTTKTLGVPIEVTIPDDNLKLSVNILGEKGEVLRELVGGEPRPKGKTTVYFDGHDQWGAPLTPGTYKWGAYLSKGLKPEYMGTAGTSGHPGYETEDGKGLWGGDHGAAIATAADATGLYFLWVSSESGRAVVKTDFDGKVIWRTTPFVAGGFGPWYAIAANGKYVFLTVGRDKPLLTRIDAATGRLLTWLGGFTSHSISDTKGIPVPSDSLPMGDDAAATTIHPESVGLAATDNDIFVSVYSENKIHQTDVERGAAGATLDCPGPRGLCLDSKGDLYAVSCVPGKTAAIVVFHAAKGAAQTLVDHDLVAPWSVAVDATGNIHVSDLGNSQQLKTFSPAGKLLRTLGRQGGRAWAGHYDPDDFLLPAGIATDAKGGLLVAEAAAPKVMSRFDAASGKLLKRWYGAIIYAGLDVPDPVDPRTVYYPVSPDGVLRHEMGGAVARAHIPSQDVAGEPDAYWCFARMGIRDLVGMMYDAFSSPVVFTGTNGKKYMFGQLGKGIVRVDGDQLIPAGHIQQKGLLGVEIWSDTNGDGLVQPEECQYLKTVLGEGIGRVGPMWIEPNGDVYLVPWSNNIIKIPATGFAPSGAIDWDVTKATFAVPLVLAQQPKPATRFRKELWFGNGPRGGIVGLRVDKDKNIYVAMNSKIEYATPTMTAAMIEGLGHSSESNLVKIAKFAPDGHLLWIAGRKATAAARPGEMYHFWCMGGLVGDSYIAGHSEWGQFYFYTSDGFFVDSLMNNPGLAPPPGPYTFGSETFGGRIQDYPDRNEVWAYSCGMAFRVLGFDHGKIAGEQRLSGTVQLDQVYEPAGKEIAKAKPLQIAALKAEPSADKEWPDVAVTTVLHENQPLATVQLGADAQFLYARFHVVDATPLKNSADNINLAFHSGDAVALDLGPANHPAGAPAPGDIRILAAMIGKEPKLIAMKPTTKLAKHPERYVTPSGGDVNYEFVGEIPAGKISLTPDPDGKGYIAFLAIPRTFLELPLDPAKPLAGDVEVLLSGQAARGLQTVSRNYLFTPLNNRTNMIDDIPTEARQYPQYWGPIEIK